MSPYRSKSRKSRHDEDSDAERERRSSKKSKSKKSKRSRSSSSSSSSESSDDSTRNANLMKKLEAKRLADAVEAKKQRERMKANETPEEKRARRIREKASKEQKRRERMGWDKEYQHYTNDDNPFGDSHLTNSFVWSKKLEKQGYKNVTTEEIEALNRQKQWENKAELEKVKKRRQEREMERQQREDEANMMQRNREAAQFDEWERQEDQFHLDQARLRSKIRIQDGRAKPIDLLAQYISDQNLEETIEMQMHEPYTYLNGLSLQDLEDLLVDIRVYQELEKNKFTDYWADLTIIVNDELYKLRKLSVEQSSAEVDLNARREGIHSSVARDVGDVFKGKTTVQLEELRRKIEGKIESQSDGVDIGYWESLLSQLKAHMAKSRLRDRHQESLRSKLDLLRQEQVQVKKEEGENEEERNRIAEDEPEPGPSNRNEPEANDLQSGEVKQQQEEEEMEQEESAVDLEEDLLTESFRLYSIGNYSPKYTQLNSIESGIKLLSEADDETRLEKQRNKVLGTDAADEENAVPTALELRMRKEAQKGMDDDEVQFSVETNLDREVYLWSDKYRPRKPRYFNRVHTGFEWNKYNQTHYDMDNPPPKIVQGYKFNIFYPDLIDKNKTPQYSLTPCGDNRDFGTLRFCAGPPYEDIAFKIVNREWEYSYKRGFRCQFQNNIFQLWFHFKRYRYRR